MSGVTVTNNGPTKIVVEVVEYAEDGHGLEQTQKTRRHELEAGCGVIATVDGSYVGTKIVIRAAVE